MANAKLQDELSSKAFIVFRAGARRDDQVAAAALYRFVRLIETDGLTPAQAREALGNDATIHSYIENLRTELAAKERVFEKDLVAARDEILDAIRVGTNQTLSLQQQMHTDILRMNTATARLEQASRQTEADTKILSSMISSVMRNTSTRSAFAIGLAVGVLAGVPVNLGTSALYERYLSVDAWKARKPEPGDGAPAGAVPAVVHPWPPVAADNTISRDVQAWFRQSGSFTVPSAPAPIQTAAPEQAARNRPTSAPRHTPARHHR